MVARYTSTLGYGIKVPEDIARRDYRHDEDLEQDFYGTVENEYGNLEVVAGGDMWNSGKEEVYFLLKPTVISNRNEYRANSGWGKEITLPQSSPSRKDMRELWELLERIGLPDPRIGWYLITSVS